MKSISSHLFYPPVALYIHFPLCAHHCSYCDFNVISQKQAETNIPGHFETQWLQAIDKHLKSWRNLFSEPPQWRTVYLGGGTPSLLSEAAIMKLGDFLSPYLHQMVEFTCEANPESVTRSRLQALKKIGVNRLSLGIQTLQNNQLKRLERLSTSEKIEGAVEVAKEVFSNLSLDLMIGIPEQTKASLHEDLKFINDKAPEHVSVYLLTLNDDHKWWKSPLISSLIPKNEKSAEFYMEVTQFLESKEYIHYEVSNFSKKGFESLHNQNYWNSDSSYLGIGPGAHGYLKTSEDIRIRYEAERNFELWAKTSEGIGSAEVLTAEQLHLEEMYFRLRTRVPWQPKSSQQKKVEALVLEGLLVEKSRGYILSDRGWLLMESVAGALVS